MGLFLVAFIANLFIPTFVNSFPYANVALQITNLPNWIWGFGNFDGVHYLRIAQNGYEAQFSQAFFPLYPLLIHLFNFLPKNSSLDTRIFVDPTYFYTGFILSNIFFFLSLFLFYKLLRIDFDKYITTGSLILILAYPTSFYLGSIYAESLFFLLTCGCLLSARKNNFFLAGIFAFLASATKVFGCLLLTFLIIEFVILIKKEKIKFFDPFFVKSLVGILIAPMGLILYMFFLKINFNDPFYFISSQPFFGAQRSENVILLPQVIFRYIKILADVPVNSLSFFNACLELISTLSPLVILFLVIKKIRLSYFIFTLEILILPTLTGTFSSMPRYSLMSFLTFPLIAFYLKKDLKKLVILFIILQSILLSIFIRGYWVA